MKKESAIILYDGVCGLCNWVVKFTIERDPVGKFRFASLQSDFAKGLLSKFNLSVTDFDSVILIEDGRCYRKSAAALRIVKGLKGLWKILYLLIIIPSPIADFFYDFIARNRYKWFGKYDQCMVPTANIRDRFIS